MRQRAAESDVVIVNHHLLCADAAVRQSAYGEVIPDCRNAVVDEAHQLEDVATQYFGIAVSNYRVDDLVRDAERALEPRRDRRPRLATLRRAITRVDDHARAFFGALADGAARARRLGEERLRIGPDWFGDVVDDGLALVGALDGLEATLDALAGTERRPAREVNEDAATIARRAGELRDQPALPARGRRSRLRLLPRDARPRRVPARRADRRLAHRPRAAVRSHARDGADLGHAGRRRLVRLRARAGSACRDADELRVPSEFDFTEQALLYLPRRMPPPKSPHFADAVAREVARPAARAPRAARSCCSPATRCCAPCATCVELELPYPLLVQGTAPRTALLDAVPLDAERGAVRDLVVLAGRRRASASS